MGKQKKFFYKFYFNVKGISEVEMKKIILKKIQELPDGKEVDSVDSFSFLSVISTEYLLLEVNVN
jgi:hypothetical protein